jgi:ribosomal protein S18 acetylase RimI-like enzyme
VDGRLNVRTATPRDDATLLDLDVGEPGTGFPSVFARERASFFGTGDPSATLVAELEGDVVGYLRLGHPTPLAENAHVVSIEGFSVAGSRRGTGVGRALLEYAKSTARRRGATKLSLRVLSTNARAIAVYTAAGFTLEGVLVAEFVIDGRPVDDLIMAVAL